MSERRAATEIPAHLSEPLKSIRRQILPTLSSNTPPAVIESICAQIKTLRDARALIERDGIVVNDARNNAVEHPALSIERAALKLVSDLNKTWAIRN